MHRLFPRDATFNFKVDELFYYKDMCLNADILLLIIMVAFMNKKLRHTIRTEDILKNEQLLKSIVM